MRVTKPLDLGESAGFAPDSKLPTDVVHTPHHPNSLRPALQLHASVHQLPEVWKHGCDAEIAIEEQNTLEVPHRYTGPIRAAKESSQSKRSA